MGKRSAIILGIIIIAIGGAVFSSKRYSDKKTYLVAKEATEAQRELLTRDADNDGLKDWEEELWKTNIANSDTDSDGTSDFDEIRSGRNPLIAGPNDILDAETIATKINAEIESDLSRTDKFSRELFARYVNARNSGEVDIDPYFEVFYKNLQDELEAAPPLYYSADQLKVVYTENVTVFKNYGNKIGSILAKRKGQGLLEHETVILDRANSGKPEELQKLDGLITEYTRIRDELAKVEVPDNLLVTHLDLLNSVAGILEGIQGMKLVFSDPVRSAAMMQRYPDAAEALPLSLRSLGEFFRKNNISFEQSEDGYLLTLVI